MSEKLSVPSGNWRIGKRLTPKLAERYTAVPAIFLEHYHRLNVSSSEAMLIIHLLSFKWDEKKPFPRVARIADRMGMTETAVRQNARSLEKKHLLLRIQRSGTSNLFDLTPLFKKLEEILVEEEKAKALLDSSSTTKVARRKRSVALQPAPQ
jgi:DNA replication protein